MSPETLIAIKKLVYKAMSLEDIDAIDLSDADEHTKQLVANQRTVMAEGMAMGEAIRVQEQAERPSVIAKAAELGVTPEEVVAMAPVGRFVGAKLEFPRWPDTNEKKNAKREVIGYTILSTSENVEYMLGQYGIRVRYNEMSKTEEIALPGCEFSQDNADNAAIAEITSIARRNGLPITELLGFISLIAERNRYHPVRDWVMSKPWDGVSRLQALCDTLAVAAEYEAHRNAMVNRWALSAICAAFSENKNDSFHGTLVLQGPQGIGKTSWTLRLAPEIDGAAKGGMHLNPSNKDSQLEALKHWIVELGELDGNYRKVDINELKGWLTKGGDELRQVYKHKHNQFKRRTVFAATVNESKFLVDSTGNRRWWTIPVLSIDYKHSIDMQQFWAEVYTKYRAGEQWFLTKEEEAGLARLNGNHEIMRPMDELLESYFHCDKDEIEKATKNGIGEVAVNATIISRMLNLGFAGQQGKLSEMGKALVKLTGHDAKSVRSPHGPIKGWRLVPRDKTIFTIDML
jgi:putative DNA primase/helicase